jgi:hypothetical protein
MEWRSMGLGVRTLAAEERIAALEAALTDARTAAAISGDFAKGAAARSRPSALACLSVSLR